MTLPASFATAIGAHDKGMADVFLAALDPGARKFTFQFFSDCGDGYAEIFHGSLDEVWPKVEALNTSARRIGVFVTINQTDFRGRRQDNIVRPRAAFVDADGANQIKRCREAIRTSGAEPTIVVRSSPGRAHFYWCCDDLSLAAFSELQSALIQKLGTDPAVKDLPRVMRLPGTLHLKEPGYPREVTFKVFNPQPWKVDELTLKLGLSALSTTKQQPKQTDNPYLVDSKAFTPADAERIRRLFGPVVGNELGGGLETNLEEIRSAVAAIPASAISTEHDWVKFTRGLAHEARVYEGQAEQLWEIVDAASRRAPATTKSKIVNAGFGTSTRRSTAPIPSRSPPCSTWQSAMAGQDGLPESHQGPCKALLLRVTFPHPMLQFTHRATRRSAGGFSMRL